MIEKRATMASGGAADIVNDAAAVDVSAGTFYVLLCFRYVFLWCVYLTDESW